MRQLALSLVLSVAATVPAAAQSRLLLVSQRDHTFHEFDPVTLNEILKTVESEDAGHEVLAAPDGKTAYVPIYGNAGVGRPGTDGDHIDIFDVQTGKLTGSIKFPHGVRPHRPVWDKTTGMMYVSSEIDKTATIIDPQSGKIIGAVPTGAEQSHMITLLPDGKKLYTANVQPGSVSVVDVKAKKTLKVIPISSNTQRLSCSNDGRYVFTSDQTQPDLVVIDTTKDEIIKRIKLPSKGYGSTPTPDGKWLLVAMADDDGVAVIDLKTMQVAKTIPSIKGINEFVVSGDGKYAYATSPKLNLLAKIDLVEGKTVKTVDAGKYPDGMWLTR